MQTKELVVAAWAVDDDSPLSQVHIIFHVENTMIIARLKSARITDELIASLQKHRQEVWG